MDSKGKLIWYQYFGDKIKEVNNINLGSVQLMAKDSDWTEHKFAQATSDDLQLTAAFYHAKIQWKWTGANPIYDCKYVLKPSNHYTGSADADGDLNEIYDWSNDGSVFGLNKYPTSCQIYNPVEIVIVDDDDEFPAGFKVQSWDDLHQGYQICRNLGEAVHKRCLPCIGDAGNIDNLNMDEQWSWVDSDRTAMYTEVGGLMISQGADIPTDDSWELFDNSSDPPFTIAVTENNGTINPDELQTIYLRICIPWGVFCGGKRCIGLGLDYIYTH